MIDHHHRMTVNEEETSRGLSLVDTQTSFYILGIGLVFCTFVFLYEVLSHKCSHRRRGGSRQVRQ